MVRKAVILLVPFLVLACSSLQFDKMTWEQKATFAYTTLGETLLSVHNQIDEVCTSSNSEQCSKAKSLYNQAVDIYTTAGTMLKVAVSMEDPKQLENYAGLITQIQSDVLPELTKLIKKYLVKEVGNDK